MGVDHDAAVYGLPEDLRQACDPDRHGVDHVGQHASGADRGQLIDVADEQQTRSLGFALVIAFISGTSTMLVEHQQVALSALSLIMDGSVASDRLIPR